MNLQQTVSKLLNREVSLEEAKDFANDQFGLISAYLESKIKPKNSKPLAKPTKLLTVDETESLISIISYIIDKRISYKVSGLSYLELITLKNKLNSCL